MPTLKNTKPVAHRAEASRKALADATALVKPDGRSRTMPKLA